MNSAMKKHLGNMSRLSGNDTTKKYSYVLNQNDLVNAYVQLKDELGYPLMIESKYRRAIVYNKKGIEKHIADMINNNIKESLNELGNAVANDIVNDVASQLINISKITNGALIYKSGNSTNRVGSFVKFTNLMAKGLMNGISKILDDIMSENDK